MVLKLHSLVMAQPKAIFIGRDHPDTGLVEYQILAKRFNLNLDVFTTTPDASRFLPNYNYAFVSRYLTIIESLAAGIPVIAHYNNAIKYDYLTMSPFIKFIKIFTRADDPDLNLKINSTLIKAGQKWAQAQTWPKVAALYEKLWRI